MSDEPTPEAVITPELTEDEKEQILSDYASDMGAVDAMRKAAPKVSRAAAARASGKPLTQRQYIEEAILDCPFTVIVEVVSAAEALVALHRGLLAKWEGQGQEVTLVKAFQRLDKALEELGYREAEEVGKPSEWGQ